MAHGETPDSVDDMPEDCVLDDIQTIGTYDTIDEAFAEARRINEVHLLTTTYDYSWAIVVVQAVKPERKAVRKAK